MHFGFSYIGLMFLVNSSESVLDEESAQRL